MVHLQRICQDVLMTLASIIEQWTVRELYIFIYTYEHMSIYIVLPLTSLLLNNNFIHICNPLNTVSYIFVSPEYLIITKLLLYHSDLWWIIYFIWFLCYCMYVIKCTSQSVIISNCISLQRYCVIYFCNTNVCLQEKALMK